MFDFGRACAGEMVKHDFVFTNIGNALLEITGVHASCGCTTAGEWSKKVEPGRTGTIPIQFHSGSFAGPILKTVTVTSTDKTQPSVMLQIKGTVWKPIEINPAYAVFNVTSESVSNATSVIRIVNNREEALTLSPPESNNRLFAAELQTNQPGKDFTLVVKTVPPLEASGTQGVISMRTSATNMPTLGIVAMIVVQAPLVAVPDRIVLPAGPLRDRWTTAVTIRNQLAAPLTLTEPAVNPPGFEYEVKESEPGRVYTITFAFPADFQLFPSASGEFSIKSSHAQNPLVKIPITQVAFRPAMKPPAPLVIAPAEPATGRPTNRNSSARAGMAPPPPPPLPPTPAP